MMPSGARPPDPAQMHAAPGPALFRSTPPVDGPVPDAHERNAMIGHTLAAVDSLLGALRSDHPLTLPVDLELTLDLQPQPTLLFYLQESFFSLAYHINCAYVV